MRSKRERHYELVAVNDRTGFSEVVSADPSKSSPLTHREALIVRSEFNLHRDVRIVLREIEVAR